MSRLTSRSVCAAFFIASPAPLLIAPRRSVALDIRLLQDWKESAPSPSQSTRESLMS
ncbi:hypothetical protein LHJ74_14275 [Streptomyces sp. N2-109]|uniref:Uncharacterized protein n=1 Tax=Streptomyces gossypii TaxID=2883101 RepID=A0ABT2JT55_9ACTN|nr:hypothetical protein [Streptomyces gossypii]MCT2591062.1 hypothetical protein [Streptomyces gossypii]